VYGKCLDKKRHRGEKFIEGSGIYKVQRRISKMPKPKAVIDYIKCHPERCDAGVCAGVSECPHGILIQDTPWEIPYILQDFCVGCGKCSTVCPFKAIKMIE